MSSSAINNIKGIALTFALAAGAIGVTTLVMSSKYDQAEEAVLALGLKNVDVGFSPITTFFRCGEDDTFGFNFTAKRPDGATTSGHVCSGLFKGATPRF